MADGEIFPKHTWFGYIRLAQGDSDKEDALMQDNESCTLFHKNHPFSVGKGSKHINFRCFFVVDKLEKKEVKISCCTTDKIVAVLVLNHFREAFLDIIET